MDNSDRPTLPARRLRGDKVIVLWLPLVVPLMSFLTLFVP
jgi:hypothetical protein